MPRPDEPDRDALIADALAHHRAGRLAEAEAGYRAALERAPQAAGVLHNLGVLAAETGRLREAVGFFDRAVAAEPAYASAHFNRAGALRALGEAAAAREAYQRTVALDAGHYQAHQALGYLWLADGRRDRALDHFARTLELRRGEDRTGMADFSLTHATRAKLRHDAAQLRHIAARHRDAPRFEQLARTCDHVAGRLEGGDNDIVALPDDLLAELGDSYNTPYHLADAPELPAGALDPALDGAALARRFADSGPGIVWFDGLLAPRALALLRRYLLDSTIWYDFAHIPGCLAAYLEDGLACPLFLQIADQLRTAFSAILEDRPLTQAWAFKSIEPGRGIDVHADDGAVSLNFWVTPDEANRDAAAGGLIVHTKAPPPDWRITQYDADVAAIRAYIADGDGGRTVVPYAANRAVLFESRLFHESGAVDFRPGYENHRINITMLFGGGDAGEM